MQSKLYQTAQNNCNQMLTNSRWDLGGFFSLKDPRISNVCFLICGSHFLTLFWLAYTSTEGLVMVWVTVIKPSVFILFSPVFQAASDSLSGANAGNYPRLILQMRKQAQRNGAALSQSQAALVVRQGLLPPWTLIFAPCILA